MRRVTWIAVIGGILLLAGCAHGVPRCGKPFVVAKNAQAQCRIVIREDAPPSTQYAAEELQRFLGEITSAQIQVVRDNKTPEHTLLLAGIESHLPALRKTDIQKLGKEGYVIDCSSAGIVISGGEPRGVLYGVYGLLEDHLGCRWFTTTVSRIPKSMSLEIKPFRERVIPVMEYREPFVADCFDGDWCARNRMNSSSGRLEEKHGGKVTYFGFVHTFDGLVPPEQYFDAHPEYFSLIDGKRLKEGSQLCCTNEDVVRIVTEEIRKRMREHPEATVFSVSQNDRHNPCQCDKCQAIAKQEGTELGPVLYLVNRVADAVKDEFPDKLIDTLAYQYTRKAPKTMRPAPNVIIRLCSIECCFSHPFETCDEKDNINFVQDVKEWSKKCNRLWVWNYDTSFSNYFTPFPSLRVRNDNIKFYVAHNVRGIFEQDVYTTLHGELSELSGYLGAKFLWNPEYDEDTAINEFLEAVYGPAAGPIRRYIDLIHDKVEKDNLHMNIWIGPSHPLLNDGVLEQADKLWDEAIAAAANDPAVLDRVQIARMPIDYAFIERMRAQGPTIYAYDQTSGKIGLNPEFSKRCDRFFEVAERCGVAQHREGGALADYKKDIESLKNVVNIGEASPVSVAKPVPGIAFKCYEGLWQVLPDFSTIQPVEQGIATDISLSATKRREQFALVFEGFVQAPVDGLYVFYCKSNDGSKLFVADKELVNNDGQHGAVSKPGAILLKAGYYPIRVEYFESGGNEALELSFEGPGIERQPVPPSSLFHAGE
ncbi:MAG: DUF4838 domain-containing protein [Candidatus Hydrogenedentes bacterium]|nr:DUF4838 domain-containing protein [Candidatus Hydrogenedentota bacterium]